MARYDLGEVEWLIEPLLPKPRGVARVNHRRVLNGMFYVPRTGSPWRDRPARYRPHTTVYNRFNRWAKAGVWVRVSKALSVGPPASMPLIDSSIVRAHQHAAGGKRGGADHAIGRSRGGLSTKIDALVDQDGLPLDCDEMTSTPAAASPRQRPGSRVVRPRPARGPYSDGPRPSPG